MLKDSCKAHGMWHLVSADGATAVEAYKEGTFDPLMRAAVMIYSRAVSEFGMAAFSHEGCPICILGEIGDRHKDTPLGNPEEQEMRDKYGTVEKFWTDGLMDSLLEDARDLGLMPKVS
jgi:hypothetical protein